MKILDFPELKQTFKYDCGASALESIFSYYGLDILEEEIIKIAKTTEKTGTPVLEIIKTINHFGLKPKLKYLTIKDLKRLVSRKIPVILRIQAWADNKNIEWKNSWKNGHYVVAVGYDKNKIYFEDPWSIKRTYLTFKELDDRWHDIDIDGKKYCNCGIFILNKRAKYNPNKAIHMD